MNPCLFRFSRLLPAIFACSLLVLPVTHVSAQGGFRTEALTDPVFRMKAYDVNIPANWKFEGAVSQGTPCRTEPFPVFRAYSPDGLSEFRRLPRFDWAMSNNAVAQRAAAQCPPIGRKLNASEFLHYISNLFGYTYVADWPTGSDRNSFLESIQQSNSMYAQHGMRGYAMSGDLGAARTEIRNGTFVIEQQLLVAIICNDTPLPDGTSSTGCLANIRAIRAPKGKLDALVATISGHPGSGANENPAWRQALNNAAAAHNQEIMRQRDASFRQWSAVMAHQHQQFMAQMQSEGESRSAIFNDRMNAKSTAASDWVDYALDQQTVTGTGGTAKVSSAYGHTWSNGQGQWYQTNDPNANPNGSLPGNWTMQQQVHGNGQPY